MFSNKNYFVFLIDDSFIYLLAEKICLKKYNMRKCFSLSVLWGFFLIGVVWCFGWGFFSPFYHFFCRDSFRKNPKLYTGFVKYFEINNLYMHLLSMIMIINIWITLEIVYFIPLHCTFMCIIRNTPGFSFQDFDNFLEDWKLHHWY